MGILAGHEGVVARRPAKTKPHGRDGRQADGIKRFAPIWEQPPAGPLPVTAGIHRVVWPTVEGGGGPFASGEDKLLVHTGAFIARLNVGGKSYTQSFKVTPEITGD